MVLFVSRYCLHKFYQAAIFIWIAISIAKSTIKTRRTLLTNSILHFETLNYPKEYLNDGHSRVRRSLNPRAELQLSFYAHNRKFELRLKRDVSIFSNGLQFDDDGTFHPSNIYEGNLKGDSGSLVHGFIHDGIFEGTIKCGDGNEFHVDSAKQYKHLDHDAFHSVIYNTKDVVHPKRHLCGGIMADPKNTHASNRSTEKEYVKYRPQGHENFDEEFMNPEVHHRQRRSTFDNNKKECRLLVRADWTFKDFAGSADRAMYLMTQYVKSVSHIYESTDFDGNAVAEGIRLNIKRITVMPKDSTCSGFECQFAQPNIGVAKFLDIASLDNHDEYCVAYVFAHRDFDDGVLGLAWIGDPTGAGGICDRYQTISGSKKSLNTGIVTNLNYGNTMARKVVEITLAHEVGHNFGSKHDPLSGDCAPGGTSGNFIMYPRATSGTEKNNYYFSSCSRGYIWPVLQAKSATCFSAPDEPICGNRIKEGTEECDCGYDGEASCKDDLCCIGSSPKNNGENPGCKFSAKAKATYKQNQTCSASHGLCCDAANCLPYTTDVQKVCANPTECSKVSHCVAESYICPPAQASPDLTTCNNGSKVCVGGECSGSICLSLGQVECQCSDEANLCTICCQDGNVTSTCKPYEKDGNQKRLPSGSPCEHYAGYCDFLSKCRKVDAEGPLSKLKKWLFSSKTITNILDWMKTYWWACILIGLGLVLFMAAFIACCSVHTPSSNPNKPPPRHLSLPRTLSRRNRHATAPPPNYGEPARDGYQQQQPTASNYPPGYPDDKSLPGYNTAMRQPPSYEMR